MDVDEEKKDLKMFVQKEIVEEVENPGSQISLEEAKRLSAKNELGASSISPWRAWSSAASPPATASRSASDCSGRQRR